MHDLVATLRRIAGTKPAKTPAALLVTAGQLRHLAQEIELLLGRADHLGRSRDDALEAVAGLQRRVAELLHDDAEHPAVLTLRRIVVGGLTPADVHRLARETLERTAVATPQGPGPHQPPA